MTWNNLCLIYVGIGILWFIYVIIVCIFKNGRLHEGTLIGCTMAWPVTFFLGYLRRVITGKRNQYDPLDLTDFGE